MNTKQILEKEVGYEEKENVNLTQREFCEIGPLTPRQRREEAFYVRQDASIFQRNLPLLASQCNGDEELYANKIGNYSKALPHNKLGEVNIDSYNAWIKALMTGNPKYFEAIPLGGVTKLVNPQASYCYDLVGADSHHLTIPAAPSVSSSITASEMAEDYWLALTRDVPFGEYNTNPLTIMAAEDLSRFSDFDGPKENGVVTTETLFRANTPGDLIGPYISQFLYKDIPFGNKTIIQQYRTGIENYDYMTLYSEWLNIQNGGIPTSPIKYDSVPRYIRNGRDLSSWVHLDFTYQCVLDACLILQSLGQAALAQNNPYLHSKTQNGFVTFGAAYILDFVAKSARQSLEAAWFQKFLVYRRLRPEEFGGLVQNYMTCKADYPINSELLNSKVISKIFNKFGTYLLPMAYPEGCPNHPAYPAGHACIAGAGVTILKAFFNEAFIIPSPVVASSDGFSLIPYSEHPLTVGGELNKLASNIALGRDTAGVHWRSDGIEGLKLGEAVAISILQDYRETYNEDFKGFSFIKFDGTRIII